MRSNRLQLTGIARDYNPPSVPPPGPPTPRARSATGLAGSLLLAPLALIALIVAWRFAGLASDDVFITYRYAQNLAAGHGLVFNPGERVFGVTDPGVALGLGAAHAATGIAIPLLGTAVTAAALLALTAFLYAGSERRRPEALAAGGLLVLSPYLWTTQGTGPLIALALLLAAAHLSAAPPLAAGLLAGLAVWCRPDAAVGVALLGLLLWREARRFPRAYAAAALGVILAGSAAAWAWFGTVVPATLGAKRQYAALAPHLRTGAWVCWGRAVDTFLRGAGPLGPTVLALGLAGQLPLWRSAGRPGRLLVLHAWALAAAYTLLRVPFFLWYVAPAVVALLAGAAFAAGALLRWTGAGAAAASRPSKAPAVPAGPAAVVLRTAGLALVAFVAAASLLGSWRWMREGQSGDWRLPTNRTAGEWIRPHTPPPPTVFAEEVGTIAYYAERPVEDPIGLVSPRSLPFAAVGDMAGAFLARPTDLVLFHTFTPRGGTRPVVSRPWFAAAYEEAARLDLPRLGGSATLFRRRAGATVPPPRPPRAHPVPDPGP